MKVKVNPGWQLGVEGEPVSQPGEIVDAPDELAEQWIAAGQATAVKDEKKAKAVEDSQNKAVPSSANKSFTSAPIVTGKPVGPK